MTEFGSDRDPPDGLPSVLDRLEVTPKDQSLIASLMSELEAAEPKRRAKAVDRAKVALSGHSDTLITLGRALSVSSLPDCVLLSARVFLEVLQSEPDSPDAIHGITSALRYVDELEDAESVVEEAVRLTQGDSRVLRAWTEWLGAHGHEDRRRVLVEEALTRALGDLEAAPDDPDVITSLVFALEDADAEARSNAVDRARATLSGCLAGLVRFGDALRHRSFSGCELMSAGVLLDALRVDPLAPAAVAGIVSALPYISSTEDARSVVKEALRLTSNDSDLLSAWARRLDRAGGVATAVPVLPRGSGYGPCRCSGTFRLSLVEVRLRVHGKVVVLDDVPQGVCPDCGVKVYKSNVLAVIEALLH